MPKKQELTRRDFLKMSTVALLGAGGGTGLYYVLNNKKPFSEWYKQNLSNAKGKIFTHPYFSEKCLLKEKVTPREGEIVLAGEEANLQLGYLPEFISNSLSVKRRIFVGAEINNQLLKKYEEICRRNADEFMDFLNIRNNFELNLISLNETTKIEDNKAYFVWSFYDKIEGCFLIEDREGNQKKLPAEFGRTNLLKTSPLVFSVENPVSAFASPLEAMFLDSKNELKLFLLQKGKKHGFSQKEIDDYFFERYH